MCVICRTKDHSTLSHFTQLDQSNMCYAAPCIADTFVNLTILDCYACGNIDSIPSTLVNLTLLRCSDTKIKTIPSTLTNLTTLRCRDCTKLEAIPILPNLTTLDCSGCKKITTIPEGLTSLTVLGCYLCPRLTSISPTLTTLQELDCALTPLTNIPSTFTNLLSLNCQSCRNIMSIPHTFSQLMSLNCSDCKGLYDIGVTRKPSLLCSFSKTRFKNYNWITHEGRYKYTRALRIIKTFLYKIFVQRQKERIVLLMMESKGLKDVRDIILRQLTPSSHILINTSRT